MQQYWRNEEKLIFELRALYEQYGYRRYKMNKFEEYDFYAENKQFLVSGNVITFTDRLGRLMALKPDVTLSIARHHEDGAGVTRVYYNENVYRADADGEFREIPQTGLECIGDPDAYTMGETVLLAVKSLAAIGRRFVLNVADMGILQRAVKSAALPEKAEKALYRAIESKSDAGVRQVFAEYGGDTTAADTLCRLMGLHGSLGEVLPTLKTLMGDTAELESIEAFLNAGGFGDAVRFDFSLLADKEYYNGAVFCGYVEGVPAPVLSGGRYDGLMKKLGKKSGAVGFAVYLDLLERLDTEKRAYDVDVLLTYEGADPAKVFTLAETLRKDGNSVCVLKQADETINARTVVNGKEATDNA